MLRSPSFKLTGRTSVIRDHDSDPTSRRAYYCVAAMIATPALSDRADGAVSASHWPSAGP